MKKGDKVRVGFAWNKKHPEKKGAFDEYAQGELAYSALINGDKGDKRSRAWGVRLTAITDPKAMRNIYGIDKPGSVISALQRGELQLV